MALLDTTIVNVAIPTIRTSLGASESTLSWVISGYALAYGLALIPAGRVGDRYGHKWVFIVGLALFTVASLACGLAQNDVQLIAVRVVQGLAGGIFFTPVTALIQLMFPGRLRGKAFAIMGATIGFSTALGPLTGGLIIEAFGAHDGWRWVFGVNLPIGVLAVAAACWLLPSRAEGARDTGSDWIGLVLIAGGLVALLVPLIQGQDQGWPEWTYLSMAGGVALIVGFAFWERRVARLGGRPLVPPHLFAHASFTGGVVLAFVYFAAFTSIFFSVALLWQAGLGATALQSGLVVLPFAIGSIIGAAQSDQLARRFGRTVLLIGLGLVAVGIIAIWLVLVAVVPTSLHGWYLTVPLFLGGVGSGLFIAPNADFIVATVGRAEAGAASGVIGTVQRIGSAVGIAVTGSVLFGTLDFTTPGPDAAALAFAHSATYAMGVSAGFAVLAFALGFTLPKRPTS
ncbi:MFS transporter [Nonomuraea sp. NEAU-A123]|nr:MFS transporter [Nonomuraea sp. NEAU-A123]